MKWEKGDKVITPSGRVAEVTKVNRQGDVLLRYEGTDDTDLVTLRHDVKLIPAYEAAQGTYNSVSHEG